MTEDAKDRMDRAERLEWLDEVEEWAGDLAEMTEDYARDCTRNGGNLLPLEDDLVALAANARDVQARLGLVLDAARAEAEGEVPLWT